MTDTKPPLKLVAMDASDLEVISACCQDGVLKIADLEYLGREKRFLLSLNRFVWEDADKKKNKKEFERRRTVLHFERVSGVQLMGIDRSETDMVLSLMAVTFSEGEAPGGVVELVFAGDGAIRLEVECIEAQLSDLSAAWETKSLPTHSD